MDRVLCGTILQGQGLSLPGAPKALNVAVTVSVVLNVDFSERSLDPADSFQLLPDELSPRSEPLHGLRVLWI